MRAKDTSCGGIGQRRPMPSLGERSPDARFGAASDHIGKIASPYQNRIHPASSNGFEARSKEKDVMNGTRPRLYVGNLPYQLTIDELKDFFAGAGSVTDAAIITDRETGRSKGFGFVEFATDEDATRAQSMFNGAQLRNRTLKVDLAKPRDDKARDARGSSSASRYR